MKKVIFKKFMMGGAICLALAMGVSAFTTEGVFHARGDVNGDGIVDTGDVSYLQGIHAGDFAPNPNADVDGNRVTETRDLAFLQGLLTGTLPTGGDLMDHVTEYELTKVTGDCDYGITMQTAVVHGDSNRALKVWTTNFAGKPTAVLTFDESQDWSGSGSLSFDTLFVNDADICSLSVSVTVNGQRYHCGEVNPAPQWSTSAVSLDGLGDVDLSKVEGICFTYNFADGSNRFDGTTRHAVYIDNLTYTPGAVRMRLWDTEALPVGSVVGSVDTTGHSVSAYVKGGSGVMQSQALAFQLSKVVTSTSTNTLTVSLADYGFRALETYTDDQLLWFWVDSALSADARMVLALDNHGFRAKGYAPNEPPNTYEIFTIVADENGNPTLKNVCYQADDTVDADGVDGLSYVHYTSSGNVNALARVKVSSGWSGWVGIPLKNFWEEKTVNGVKQPVTLAQYCGQWEKLTLQLYKSNNKDSGQWVANECFYLDEFWVTDAGAMPRLSNEKLLYRGQQDASWGVSVWNFEDHAGKLDLTASRANRNTSRIEDAMGYGVGGSVAMRFWMQTEDARTNTGSNILTNSITQTQTLSFADYGVQNVTVRADDDIFWFWVDAELSTPQRLLMQLNDSGLVSPLAAGVEEAYIYTIEDLNGAPVMKRVDYRAVTTGPDTDGVDGLDLLNGDPYSDKASSSLIRLGPDWSGWIGIPMDMLGIPAGTEITKFSVYLRQFEPVDGYIAEQNAGDGVYLDEFWLTDGNAMPKLSPDKLLYRGSSQRTGVQILSFADGVNQADISKESYIKDNTANTDYSTIALADGRGSQGKSAIKVTITEDNKVGDWWWVNTVTIPETVAVADNRAFTELLPGTSSADLMLWLWVDGTGLSHDARLNMGFTEPNGTSAKYTQYKQYYIDAFGQVQELCLSVNSTGDGLIDSNVRGRVTVEAGASGWIGIPVSYFGTGLNAMGELRFSLHKGLDRYNGNKAISINAGEYISIGDIWLTKKDEQGNWTIPLPAQNDVQLHTEYYTAEDYLADPDLFVPAWTGQFTVPAGMLDWEEKFTQFYTPNGRTMIVAHRGDRNNLYPENSIEGFLSVIAAGVDMVEVDVIKTKDGIPVALHGGGTSGNDLLSSTNLKQLREKGIAYHLPDSDDATDWTLEELRQLRLTRKGTVTDYVIPTLEEVITVAKGRVFVTLDKFSRFDWETDIVPILDKTGAYETVLIPYNYFHYKGYSTVVAYIKDLKAKGARKVAVMTEAYDTDVATIAKNVQRYGLPMVLRLHEFSPGDAEYADAFAPYVGKFRMYCETLQSANDNAEVWQEMADMGMNLIMSNDDPYLLCQFVAQRHFAQTEE